MPSTTETSADDDDEEDAGLWLFSQAGQKEPDEDVQVERLTERHVQDVQLQMGRFWDNDYEAADRVCRERSQHNLVYALAHSFWGVTRACFTLEASQIEEAAARIARLQESIRSESWLPPFANYELGVLLLRSRSTASEGLKKLHEVAAFTPDYDFKLKLVLKCHLTLIDYEDRTMGSAEA